MGRLSERIATARRALGTLRELAEKRDRSVVERDAALQRFEYSVEAVWKAVQLYLRTVEGLEIGSPKAAVRASFETGLLNDAEARAALVMIDDGNLTVQTYEEPLADEIASRLAGHAALLDARLERAACRTPPGDRPA